MVGRETSRQVQDVRLRRVTYLICEVLGGHENHIGGIASSDERGDLKSKHRIHYDSFFVSLETRVLSQSRKSSGLILRTERSFCGAFAVLWRSYLNFRSVGRKNEENDAFLGGFAA